MGQYRYALLQLAGFGEGPWARKAKRKGNSGKDRKAEGVEGRERYKGLYWHLCFSLTPCLETSCIICMVIWKYIVRPPDILCRRTYILLVFLLLSDFFLLFFRHLISEVAEWNSTKIGHMVRSKCNLKMHVRNLGYPLPLQIGGPKPPFLDDFAT